VIDEGRLLLVQFVNVFSQSVKELDVGDHGKDVFNQVHVALLLADELRKLTVVLQQLVVVERARPFLVFKKHDVDVAMVKQIECNVLEVGDRTPSLRLLFLALAHRFVVVEFDRVDGHCASPLLLPASTDVKMHVKVNRSGELETLGPARLAVSF